MLKENFELLAPAGSFEILKAVIEAGADAVYVGGSKYGARAYANNFTEEELLEAIDYVHLRGKKLFLTVNTLFKNDELNEGLYEYLLPYYKRGLDAVIVQDFGVLAYIKKYFPNLPIHTSTQMTVTGVEGARLLKNLGVERVVLARELSIREMKVIYEQTGVELEAFVHGALCYSYSGQCLFSSMLGGRSGNRGRCAQPCRLPYSVLDDKKKEIKKDFYILSLKDLCGIEHLNQLREAGVFSLKIEGRMKQASYAAGVVAYYRKYIDLEKNISKEDMQHLYELGNRCGFTQEYFDKQNDKSMITYEKPSYEKSNESLHNEIEAKYVGKKSQIPITGTVIIKKNQPLKFFVNRKACEDEGSAILVCATGGEVLEARNKPLELTDVYERMNKTGETSFYFADLKVELDEGVFVPNGVLNQLRRDALKELEENMLQKYFRNTEYEAEENLEKSIKSIENTEKCYIASCETIEQIDKCLLSEKLSMIYLDSMIFDQKNFVSELSYWVDRIHKAEKKVALRLPVIFRRHTAEFFESIKIELKSLPLDGMVVRNYEEIFFVSTNFPEMTMIADYNLYTYNDLAKYSYENLGISYTTIPLELNQKEIRGRDNANSEMVIYGYYPLMVTANCVHKNTTNCDKVSGVHFLKDRYNVLFPVKNFCNACYNIIYNSVPTCLFKEQDKLEEMNIHRMRLDFTIERGDEITNVLARLVGRGTEVECTKGHYKRGVE
ncbi:MAG: DUF3656 domain-containing protein [Agathobacter sp.]